MPKPSPKPPATARKRPARRSKGDGELLTTRQIADRHGVAPQSIAVRAKRNKMAPAKRIGNVYLWTPAQAERLAPGKVGRPRTRPAE